MQRLAALSGLNVVVAVIFVAILLPSSIIFAQTNTTKPIGNYIISKGTVTVTHPGETTAIPVKVRDGVLFRDIITTSDNSKTKALFVDDSILTLGENSSVEITEHVYDPNTDTRSAIVNLIKGKLRVLVGKTFLGLGSKFEIHTNHASVAARGTYMVIWVEPDTENSAIPASYITQAVPARGGTGVALLNGTATFTTPQGSVTVPTGQFSFATPGTPPSMPTMFTNTPFVQQHIAATNVKSKSSPAQISAVETLSKQGQGSSVLIEVPKTPTPIPSPSSRQTSNPTTDDGDTSGNTTKSSGTPTTPTTSATPHAPPSTVITTIAPAIPVAPLVPVEIQMEPEMARIEAAMIGGRELPALPKQPTGTLTIQGPKLP